MSAFAQLKQARAAKDKAVHRMKAIAKVFEARDPTPEEQAEFDRLRADADRYNDVISGLMDSVEFHADASPAANDTNRIGSFGRQDGAFADFADFANAVRTTSVALKRGLPQMRDQRLMPLAAAPSTGANEGSGADGGFATPTAYSRAIFSLAAELAEPSLLEFTSNEPLLTNQLFLPRDTAVPWDSTGLQVAWTGEMKAATPTKPMLAGTELRMKKIMGLAPISNELGADGILPGDYLASLFSVKTAWAIGEAILFGSGAGTPLGALNSNAAVVVAKDTGQVANTLSATNLANMLSRLPPGSMSRARWLINPSVLPALLTLTLGNFPIYLPCRPNGRPFEDAPGGRLLGLPVQLSQHAAGFSSQGDVCLVDLSYYQAITKAEGIQTASSMHLYFDADATAFRITFRMDGAPKLTAPITPPKSSATLSPFVLLGAR